MLLVKTRIFYFYAAKLHEVIKPGRTDLYVSVSRRWDLFHSSSCSCGEPKDVTIKVSAGISTQIYNKSDLDITANLGFGLASISSKVSKESGESLTISTEQTIEDKTTFHAPECGRKTINIYQLITNWRIRYYNSKGILRKIYESKETEFDVRESQWYYDYKVLEPASECNCQPKVSHDAAVGLEAKNASITLPCNISVDKITIYGIENKTFSKGDTIGVAELRIEIPNFLRFMIEEKAEIIALLNREQNENVDHYETKAETKAKTLEISPDDYYSWNNKGNALFSLGRYNEAIECYDKSIKINSKDSTLWNNKGNALYNLGGKRFGLRNRESKFREAIKCYDKAIMYNRNNGIAWNNKGNALLGLYKTKEAVKCYDRALKLDPSHADAYIYNKGLALNPGKRIDAEEYFVKAKQLGHTSS